MSATRDKNQKVAFVYSNLYQIYRKGKEAASSAEVPEAEAPVAAQLPQASQVSSHVLKTEDLNSDKPFAVKVRSFEPAELIGKRIKRPEALRQKPKAENSIVDGLKENLKTLNDLHARLRFMLEELEELVKE